MPKIVDYPLFSFPRVLELANTVDYLGGSCTIPDCAHQMKKKVSGGFGILVSSAIKHDLIQRKSDRLTSSDLYKKIKFSYNPTEKIEAQRVSFLHPILYRKIYDRFKGKELPFSMLDKLLIREFQVEEKISSKIAGFFVEGLKRLSMIKDGKLLAVDDMPSIPLKDEPFQLAIPTISTNPDNEEPTSSILPDKKGNGIIVNTLTSKPSSEFMINIEGEGLRSTLVIKSEEDLVIVQAMLEKIRKHLKEGTNKKE